MVVSATALRQGIWLVIRSNENVHCWHRNSLGLLKICGAWIDLLFLSVYLWSVFWSRFGAESMRTQLLRVVFSCPAVLSHGFRHGWTPFVLTARFLLRCQRCTSKICSFYVFSSLYNHHLIILYTNCAEKENIQWKCSVYSCGKEPIDSVFSTEIEIHQYFNCWYSSSYKIHHQLFEKKVASCHFNVCHLWSHHRCLKESQYLYRYSCGANAWTNIVQIAPWCK